MKEAKITLKTNERIYHLHRQAGESWNPVVYVIYSHRE